MRAEFQHLEKYLNRTLGVALTVRQWKDSTRLAPFLRKHYSFREAEILGTPCLLMLDEGEREQAAGVILKHTNQVKEKWPGEVIYVRDRLTPYNRDRLVDHNVPFVVPGNQMYLPMLAVDFREHFRRQLKIPAQFSPATQAMVIQWLLEGGDEPLTPTAMVQRLGYAPMTMTRAFDELQATEFCEVTRLGKERRLRFVEPKRDVWMKTQPFLRDPVTKRAYVPRPGRTPGTPQAGLMALAHYTMLAPPRHPVIALDGRDWRMSPIWRDKTAIPEQDKNVIEVEVWRYRPDLFAKQGVVDQLSLYLSLRHNEEERVQAALEEMIGRVKW